MRLDDPTGSILHQVKETYGAFVWAVAVVGAAVGVWLTAALS